MSDLQLNSVAWDKSPKRYYDLAHAKKEIKTKDDRTPEEIIEDFLNAFKKGKEEEDGIT